MANTIQIKRSLLSAAPVSLAEGEFAYTYGNDTLYLGAPGATMIIIAGASTFAKLASPIFTGLLTTPLIKITGGSPGSGKVLTSDADGDATWEASGAVSDGDKGDITVSASGTTWTVDAAAITLAKMANIATDSFIGRDTAGTGVPEVLSVATVKALLVIDNVTNTSDANKPVSTAQQTALDLKANLASPTFSGTPSLPTGTTGTTQSPGDNTTKLSTTAFVAAAIAALIDSSPGALDTLNELAAALGDDANFAASTATALGLKMVKTANLSDVADVATSRTNLGLGTMAVQNKTAVDIEGGTIDGCTIDTCTIGGGTF